MQALLRKLPVIFTSVYGEPNGQVGQDESMLRNNVVPLPEEIEESDKWGLT